MRICCDTREQRPWKAPKDVAWIVKKLGNVGAVLAGEWRSLGSSSERGGGLRVAREPSRAEKLIAYLRRHAPELALVK